MTRDEVVDQVKQFLDRLIDVNVNAIETAYKRDLLRLFKQVEAAGAMIAGDALSDRLDARYPAMMNDARYVDLFAQVQKSWDEWRFYTENEQTVAT